MLTAPGLLLERQWYLYHKIRPYVQEECKDILCPRPEDPLPPRSAQVPRKRRASEHDAGPSGLGRAKAN